MVKNTDGETSQTWIQIQVYPGKKKKKAFSKTQLPYLWILPAS